MDKFGIFKLLNSFLGQDGNSPSQSGTENSSFNNGVTDLLSSFLKGGIKENSSSNPEKAAPKKPTPDRAFAPLQRSMLSTMNSHDEFIKRVKEKNKPL